MVETIFLHLALILTSAFIVSWIARIFKQPPIIGYILAGIIISPFIIKLGASQEIIKIFSEFGIAFLLFIVGLHMNPKVIKEVGVVSFVVGLIQIILTFGIGFIISNYVLGFNSITSAYLGIALSFSSTIITMKLLSDKKHLETLYGKISIGILIIQDLVAVIALMIISSISNTSGSSLLISTLKTFSIGLGLIIGLFIFGYLFLPKITRNIARSQELLFLFAVTWPFAIAGIFGFFNFSIEIGALIAGIVLSVSPYSIEISSKIRPLRDFFLVLFFIILGLNIEIGSIGRIIITALILSAIALIIKPIILILMTGLFGYRKRTNFFVGITLAQISEFSLIVGALGLSLGHITPDILSTITLTGLITIFISTYGIIYSDNLYKKISKIIPIFERKNPLKEKDKKNKYHAILFGYNKIGFHILKTLKESNKKYLTIDYNPDTIAALKKYRIPCIFGDIFDHELLDNLALDKIELGISTIPDFETNRLIIEKIREKNEHAIIISRAHRAEQALELYKKGADYVVIAQYIGGDHISDMIKRMKVDKGRYTRVKHKHIELIKDRMKKDRKHGKKLGP